MRIRRSYLLYLLGQSLNLCNGLGRRGQVIMTILGDVNIVFDTDTSDIPVPFQDSSINVLTRLRIIQNRIDNEAAEIDLKKKKNRLAQFSNIRGSQKQAPSINLHPAQQ
jgi:hypothetical protein